MSFEKHHHSFPVCAPQIGLSPYRQSTCALGQAFAAYVEESSEEVFCPGLKELLCQKSSGVALSPGILEAPKGVSARGPHQWQALQGVATLVTLKAVGFKTQPLCCARSR